MLICHPNRRHTFSKQIKNPIKSNVICFFFEMQFTWLRRFCWSKSHLIFRVLLSHGPATYYILQRSFVMYLPFSIVLCRNRSARFGDQTNTPNHSDFYCDTAIEIMIIFFDSLLKILHLLQVLFSSISYLCELKFRP